MQIGIFPITGWDFLIEIDVVRSGTTFRRSNDFSDTFEITPTAQSYSITSGTSGNITAYEISAGDGSKQPLKYEVELAWVTTCYFLMVVLFGIIIFRLSHLFIV